MVADTDATGKLVLHGLSSSYGITRAAGISTSSTLPYPISQNVQINGVPSSGSYAQLAKFNYILWQGGGYQTTNYASVFSSLQSAAAAYSGHVLNNGFYALNDEWWTSTGVSGAFDPAKINFGLGNSPGASPGGYLRATPNGSRVNGEDANKYAADYSNLCPTFTVNTVGSITGPSPTYGAVNWSQFTAWYQHQVDILGNGSAVGAAQQPANSGVGHIINDNQIPRPSYANSAWGNTSGSWTGATIQPYIEGGWSQNYAMHRSLQSNLLVGGNFTDYVSQGITPSATGFADIGTFENCNGYALGYIGGSSAFQTFMARCVTAQTLMKLNLPSRCIWQLEYAGPGQGTVNAFPNSQSSWTAAHYQGARVQAGIIAGLQWVVGMSNNMSGGTGVTYIDELDAGVSTPGWIGAPTQVFFNSSGVYQSPNSTASSLFSAHGIMTFTYTNGNVYSFPPGAANAAVGTAVTIPTGMLQNGGGHHITYTLANGASGGTGAPPNGSGGFVTNGAAFTSLYLQPYDAVFTKL